MDDAAEVVRLEHEFIAAWNRGDAHAAAAVYAEDGTRVGAFGDVAHGRKEIEAAYANLLQGKMKGATADWQPSVHLLSGEIAVARGSLVIHPAGGGSAIRGYAVDVWKKSDNRWQLVEGHPKLFPPPAPAR
ncbi:MAG TPA: nuclear transport factor 2 family protein [Gemmatimonadaceae bacterium]|nr:nuclear transport factor 2 family protein [Gemmatimonadaceae bacterium]